jgi:hypothetical protein
MTFTVNNQQGYSYFDDAVNQFRNDNPIKYWLEEVEDNEDEMRNIIQRFINITSLGEKAPDYLIHDAENLLNKLKQ